MRMTPPATELLSPKQLERVRARSNRWGLYLVAHAWLTMVLAAALFVWIPNPATYVLAVMVIGSRQLGLLILMHDGAHGMLCRHRGLNDWLSQLGCAFPTFADTFVYRRYHLKHHARTLQDDDPDIILTGHYPITRASLRRKLLRDLIGRTGFAQRRAQFAAAAGSASDGAGQRVQRFAKQLGPHLLANAALLVACSVAGYWYLYPLLWVVPLLTWQQLVLRIRNIAEHAAVDDRDDPFRNSRTTLANPIERLFVAPYWVNYHLEHHLMMWAPCYRLRRLHGYLIENGHGPKMDNSHGYLEVLRDVTVANETEAGNSPRERAVGTFSDGFDS